MRRAWAVPLAVIGFGLAMVPGASADRTSPAAAGPTADQLLAKVQNCEQLSQGAYASDEGGTADIPVCAAGGSVFWEADMDVDCDGQRTEVCNENTDPAYQDRTAFTQSDGQYLNAAELPYIVVPGASEIFDFQEHGITGGTVAAVIHGGQVTYAVVGDIGPNEIIGEASYANAEALGVDPKPATGGADSGVTYILFPGATADPIENHQAALDRGAEAAQEFVNS